MCPAINYLLEFSTVNSNILGLDKFKTKINDSDLSNGELCDKARCYDVGEIVFASKDLSLRIIFVFSFTLVTLTKYFRDQQSELQMVANRKCDWCQFH